MLHFCYFFKHIQPTVLINQGLNQSIHKLLLFVKWITPYNTSIENVENFAFFGRVVMHCYIKL
nr:MAG TPA: hypothetical protein [Caudoviricetes sp.]